MQYSMKSSPFLDMMIGGVNYYREWCITSYGVNVFCGASFRNNGFHGNCASNVQIEVESAMFVENDVTSSVSSLHGILVTCNREIRIRYSKITLPGKRSVNVAL